jgi:TRAP-type mannitol/chloroaromatic compound transport system permease large subunit
MLRGALPFMLCQLLVIALIVLFPQIALWLPSRMQ